MKINIYSLKQAKEEVLAGNNKNWISIRDYGYDNLYEIMNHANNLLILTFDDVKEYDIKHDLLHPFYKKISEIRALIKFDEKMALRIKKFADNIYNNNESLNIHCYAGKSRSQGIGEILNVYYNLFIDNNKKDYINNLKQCNDKYIGNQDIERILKKIFYLN